MLLWWMGEDQIPCHKFRELLEAFLQCLEWVDGGDETPQPVQVLLGAIGSGVSGGGIVRSQGPMPSSQMAFQTPSSWNPQTPGQRGRQAFRLNEEVHNFNLFEMDEDLSHQAACAGIPQGDLLGPLGGEGHREKGFGGGSSWPSWWRRTSRERSRG